MRLRTTADMYLSQVNRSQRARDFFRRTQRMLSLLVILSVFWGLKLTGITMAGEAFCGMDEHVHKSVPWHRRFLCEHVHPCRRRLHRPL